MAITFTRIDTRFVIKQKRAITKWLKEVAQQEGKRVGGISIVLCSDEYILETNRQFLSHDYYTDIITFDYSEGDLLSGDLVISVDTVRSNAAEYGTTFERELHRVIVHGVLHLCGYKDKSPKEQKLMRQKEDFYLSQYEI